MPIYEYACKQCGQEFETLVRSSTVPDCPSCRSTDLEKKLSVFATAVPPLALLSSTTFCAGPASLPSPDTEAPISLTTTFAP